MLEGQNFLLEVEGTIQKLGFYVTRFVEAENQEEAELLAVQQIREDEKLTRNVRNIETDPPMIYLESIDELTSFEGVELPGTGYTFYPGDGDDE